MLRFLSFLWLAGHLPSMGLASSPMKRQYDFAKESWGVEDDKICSQSQMDVIAKEFDYVRQMAQYAQQNMATSIYYTTFFDSDSRDDPNFQSKMEAIYSNIAKAANTLEDPKTDADGTEEGFFTTIECWNGSDMCKSGNYIAHMNPETWAMNFCDIYFDDTKVPTTETALTWNSESCKSLLDFHMTKGAIVFHELTHTGWVMNGGDKDFSLDVAYKPKNCQKLAAGTYTGSDTRLGRLPKWCDGQDPCPKQKSAVNADSITLVADALWFSYKIRQAIPVSGTLSSSSSRLRFRRDGATFHNSTSTFCNTTSDGMSDFFSDDADDLSSNSTEELPLPCMHFADPDEGVSYCTCENGAKVSMASSTSSPYKPCPWTKLPQEAILTATPTATTTNTAQYQYTRTQMNGEVDECQSYSVANYAGFTATECAGSTAILATAPPTPHASLFLGQQKQNVGTLTASALSTSISSALDKLCPTPAAEGVMTNCTNDSVYIKGIDYIGEEKQLEHSGELKVYLEGGSYNETGIRVGMINAIAQAAMSSANGTNCQNVTHDICTGHGRCAEAEINLCNLPQLAQVERYDGTTQDNRLAYISAEWEFTIGDSSGDFDCELVGELLDIVLIELAPEFTIGDIGIGEAFTAGCEVTQEDDDE